MKICVAASPPDGETIALAVPSSGELPAAASGLDRLVEEGEATAERGRGRLVHVDGRRVVSAGAGPRDRIDADAIRDAAAAAARELQGTVGGGVSWLLDPGLSLPLAEQARAAVEGFVLGGYDPGSWKTSEPRERRLTRLTVVADERLTDAVAQAATVAGWTNRARDLANRPPNDLTPVRLAEHAAGVAAGFERLSAESLGPEELRERGMGALLGVGQGSHNPPRLDVVRWGPPGPP